MNKWVVKKLGDISDMCLGKMLDKEKNQGHYQPYLANINVRWGGFDLKNLSQMRFEEKEEERYGLKYGDLIVCEGGEPGRCAIWKDEVPKMKIQKALHRVRMHDNYNPFFVYYRFLLAGRSGELSKHFIGSTIKHLTGISLKQVEFEYPSLAIQNQIAAVLSSLDQKIEINNRINAELEVMAKTLYDYWFVQFDFPFDFAQGKPDENGNPYKSSGGKMVYSKELRREIPAGWEAGTLFDLGEIVGGSTPSREKSENFTTHGIVWITPKDLSNNKGNVFISKGETDVTKDGIKNASLKTLPRYTILLSSRAPIGYMAIATNELTTNQGFKSFVPNKDYPFSFIFYAVQSKLKIIEQYASGSTFKEISASTLKTVAIPLPSIGLTNLFHAKVLAVFEQQEKLEKENQQLAALRDWLLPMLMNGQVQVTETH